ncbi:hypothetical protein M9Y10_005898 [Tritrichomonas musculus]|uniref:BEACH domain-containing protein n=1 Tax=Tritrichomonas musculus TaxID=1915356 RepID=A0ABR2JEF2_9EUKA
MTSWFPGSIQRPQSISAVGRSANRRQSIFERIPPEVDQFIQSVSSLGKDERPDKCIKLFMKNLNPINDAKLKSYNVSNEVGRIIRHIWVYIDEYLSDQSKASTIFQFLDSGMRVYNSMPRTDQCIFRIIMRTAHTNDQELIEAITSFVQSSLQKPELQKLFFSGTQLSQIWSNIFFDNTIACTYLGPIFNNAATTFVVSDVSQLDNFLEAVIGDLDKMDLSCASSGLLFVGRMIQHVNTGDFLPSILPTVRDMALNLDNYDFLEPFIFAPTSDPPAIWAAIDSLCADPNLSIELLESALSAIHSTKQSPSSEVFSFSCFMPRILEMSDSMVKMLFEVIQNSDKETKADLFCFVMPLSQSGINTTYLEKVSAGIIWGDDLLESILQKFFIEPGIDEIQLCLSSDEHVLNISKEFISQISYDSQSTPQLFDIFSTLVNNGDDVVSPLLNTLMARTNPELYMPILIAQISENEINENLISIYTKVCTQVDKFTASFLAENGTELIPVLCEYKWGINFLVALVVNGPIPQIDDYIFENFKDLKISEFNRDELIKLMNGVPQDSSYPGYMRIPSLCAFIDDVPLNTPIDQYVFGSVAAQKYVKPTREQVCKFGVQYLSYELANEYYDDPEVLTAITDPEFNHHDLLEFNPSSIQCFTTVPRSTSFSFWFYIVQVYKQTILASFPGGNLILEDNGYISFASRSFYMTLKTWHLFSFVTIEKNNQVMLIGYLDGKKIGDINTNKTMTITLGTNEKNMNGSIWHLSPYVYMSSAVSDSNELAKIVQHGPHRPSNKRITAMNGVRYIPYKGILKYMHIYGGPSFIFNILLEVENEDQFMLLFQSAFNLFRLGCFSNIHFFNSIRYIFRRKIEFFNMTIDQLLVHELEDKGIFNWAGFIMCINDYRILTSPQVQYKIVLKVLNQYGIYLDDLSLFHTVIDVYVFMNYEDETEENMLQIIEMYVKAQPNLLKKVMITILALPFYDDENPQTQLIDDRVVDKQKKLFEIVAKSPKLFTSAYNPQDAFSLMALSGNGISMDILYFISKICITNGDYFDINIFKQVVPYFFLHIKNEKLWISLLQFLTKKEGNEIEDFLLVNIARQGILPHFIDLLTALIPFEIKDHEEENISFRILHLFYSMVMSQNISLIGLIKSIQNLCSIGYGERSVSRYPFQMTKKVVAQARRPSRTRVKASITDIYGDHVAQNYNVKKLVDLDPTLFDDMVSYMSNYGQVKMDQFAEIEIPQAEDPEDFSVIFETPIPDLVSLLAAKTLAEAGNDSSSFKKSLIPLTIYGADVIPAVAIEMHKKVILTLIDDHARLSNENFFYLIEYLTYRVVEGWWNGKCTDLLVKVLHTVPSYHRNLQNFIIACLSQTQSIENLISMGTAILKFTYFNELMKNGQENIIPSFLYLCVTKEIVESDDSDSFLSLMAEKVDDQAYRTAFNSDKLNEWIQGSSCSAVYRDCYQEITQNATANSNSVLSERTDLTRKSVHQKISIFMKTSITNETFLRKAFRFQFFSRINESSFNIELAINTLFKIKSILANSKNVPTEFCRVSGPHPLIVPFKLVPKLFEYDATYTQTKANIVVPVSHHRPSSLGPLVSTSDLPEFQEGFVGPKCLEGWDLPQKSKYNITSIFKRRFHASTNPFSCNMLLAPEYLPCVAVISYMPPGSGSNQNISNTNGSDSTTFGGNFDEKYNYYNVPTLHVLLGARISSGNINLVDKIQLCHFPIVENAMFGIFGETSLFLGHVVLNIPFPLITLKVPRTYTYKPTAIDLFTAYGSHFSFVISGSNRKTVESLISLTSVPNAKRSAQFALRLLAKTPDQVAKMWSTHIISNFDYLLYLNTVSGRSFNDYSQYPVFPWVISDYSSEDKPTTFRDLKKPMGQLDESRAEHFDVIFENTPPPKYFYGTHYSNPASVLHLLMRVEPSTLFNVVLHSGFDHPDRLFYSVEEAWKSSSSLNPADLHELIPEMYSFPCMFENINKIAIQSRSDGIAIDNVILPKWALNDPYEFIYQMRSALESPTTSANLSNWIDLIFGYKQQGQAAVEAKNLFHPMTYQNFDKSSDEMETKAQVTSILNFGQCPQQIFTDKPHIQRSTKVKSTIISSEVRICQIRNQTPNAVRIRYYDDDLYVCPKFSHFLGNTPTFVNISENGVFSINNNHITIDPVFNVTNSAQSTDNLYLTVVTGSGMILNYYYKPNQGDNLTSASSEELSSFGDTGWGHSNFHGYGSTVGDEDFNVFSKSYNNVHSLFILISRSLLPGEHFVTCAVSSHYGLVAAATEETIFLFDLTSGYLIRQLETSETVISLEFEEVQGMLIITTAKDIVVVSFDFFDLASASSEEYSFADITSVATTDASMWSSPFFVTGHEDGSVFLWEIVSNNDPSVPYSNNENEPKKIRKLRQSLLTNVNNLPVTALSVVRSNRAIIAVDIEGTACTITDECISKRVLKVPYYEFCSVCKHPFNPISEMTSQQFNMIPGNSSSNSSLGSSNSIPIVPPPQTSSQNQPLSFCALCGLPMCRRCMGIEKPNLCKNCERAEVSGNIRPIDRSVSSLSESDVRIDFDKKSSSPNTPTRKFSNF